MYFYVDKDRDLLEIRFEYEPTCYAKKCSGFTLCYSSQHKITKVIIGNAKKSFDRSSVISKQSGIPKEILDEAFMLAGER